MSRAGRHAAAGMLWWARHIAGFRFAVMAKSASASTAARARPPSISPLAALEKMKLVVVDELTADTAAVAAGISLRSQREFSKELADRLKSWRYPDADGVRYDASSQDVVAGDQLRAAHGKGVRSILHAACTLSLAQYCFDRDIPHPGFVVLDTPILTYWPPDLDVREDGDPPGDVVAAFYRDVQRRAAGQIIIMENTDPTEPLDEQTKDIVFTARVYGRYGFFPTE